MIILFRKIIKSNHFFILLISTSVIILTSSWIMSKVENISMADAVWWSLVTIATVGYGDVSPATTGGRIVASILMIIGIGFLSLLSSTITSIIIGGPHIINKNTIGELSLFEIKNSLDHFDQLSNKDIERICKILLALKDK